MLMIITRVLALHRLLLLLLKMRMRMRMKQTNPVTLCIPSYPCWHMRWVQSTTNAITPGPPSELLTFGKKKKEWGGGRGGEVGIGRVLILQN